jgi:hypothetical protein
MEDPTAAHVTCALCRAPLDGREGVDWWWGAEIVPTPTLRDPHAHVLGPEAAFHPRCLAVSTTHVPAPELAERAA